MITGMTIGAGVLGLPYVIAQTGAIIGFAYLLVIGLATIFLNLMIGEIAVRTNEPLQLAGFVGKYLGKPAKAFFSLASLFASFGVLLAYLIGQGHALSALFRGEPFRWSILFWFIVSAILWRSFSYISKVEKYLAAAVIGLIIILSVYLLPQAHLENILSYDLSKIFFPYGFVLFALSAMSSIVEAHALLPGSQRHFKKAVIIGTAIPIAVYLLFVAAVVGASGLKTTEIATLGLGAQFGPFAMLLGNIFAVLAMTTGFMCTGVALKQTLMWDHKINPTAAQWLTAVIPLSLFLFGLRSFIAVLDLVGGVIISFMALCFVLICWKAKKKGDLNASRYNLHHFWLLAIPVIAVFTFATVYYIVKMFI